MQQPVGAPGFNQPTQTSKMVATNTQIKLTVDDVWTNFNTNTGNAIKVSDAVGVV